MRSEVGGRFPTAAPSCGPVGNYLPPPQAGLSCWELLGAAGGVLGAAREPLGARWELLGSMLGVAGSVLGAAWGPLAGFDSRPDVKVLKTHCEGRPT